jgi:transposase
MGSRDWNRIAAELGSALPGNHRRGRPQPAHPSRKTSKLPKIDTDSILKHIEEALQEHDDSV